MKIENGKPEKQKLKKRNEILENIKYTFLFLQQVIDTTPFSTLISKLKDIESLIQGILVDVITTIENKSKSSFKWI